jgi:hypothetical protein
VFEDDEAEEHPQLYDGVFLEVDADGDIVIPPEVEAMPEPDAIEEEPVQDAAGNDPDDSGDDSFYAQLAGQQPPEEAEASCPSRSPPRKRLRYGTPAATTSLQWNRN